jgi:RNA polymerase sigma factor (sigma-70 family)
MHPDRCARYLLSVIAGQPSAAATRPTGRAAVSDLVAAACRGEQAAWNELFARFMPLIRSTGRTYRLNDSDVEDVGQVVFLRLVEHVARIRDPQALPKWIATTARNESLRLASSRLRTVPTDPQDIEAGRLDAVQNDDVDATLMHAEEAEAVRAGLAELSPTQRNLLQLLADDRPLSYRDIGTLLAMPVGSIGPTRARGLARLRSTEAVRDYLAAGGIEPPQERSA